MKSLETESKKIGNSEFIIMMAFLMSLVAFTIDAMLPALGEIGKSLHVTHPNNAQFIISSVFVGVAFGLMIFGPISDSIGRKKAIYLGVSFYLTGSVVSFLAENLHFMLLGRVLQGFGAASNRVVVLAIIRDRFKGIEMARVMSFIMIIFIFVPAVAPTFGQIILIYLNWRAIFASFLITSIVLVGWMMIRLPETLRPEHRTRLSFHTLIAGTKETLSHPLSRGYMLGSGFIFGAFVGYLNSSQQILQEQYQLGELFSIYFGMLAISVGAASFLNTYLITKIGMKKICTFALLTITIVSFLFLFFSKAKAGHPPLYLFLSYLLITFFCFGTLFANFNTLAMHPLGHIAGIASSVISTTQTLIAVFLGGTIGLLYNGTVIPLISGFFLFAIISLIFTFKTKNLT